MLKLSILICHLRKRKETLDRLQGILEPQQRSDVEVRVLDDDGEISIGAKRQRLLESAVGDYICYVDDDDMVPEYYIEKILDAIKTEPDCVGFMGTITNVKSGNSKQVSYSIANTETVRRRDGMFYCGIGHLNPVKRNLALMVGFEDMGRGEDRKYGDQLKPFLKSQVFVQDPMYHYLTRSSI